jgi:Urocanase Rossmann-like domain
MSAEFFHNSQLPDFAEEQGKVAEVFRLYRILASAFPLDAQSGMGGELFYAGSIGDPSRGRIWMYAANIAGAASLGASADPAALRQAMRDGVIDFLVNSLDEALRILKNEIRKRQAVSVGVAAEPYRLVEQMLERGVLPDLLCHSSGVDDTGLDRQQVEKFVVQGSREIAFPEGETDADSGKFITWSITPSAEAPHKAARWLPHLDACALAILPAEDVIRRRWLRLAPRYLGRRMQRQHGVFLTAEERLRFEAEANQLIVRYTNQGEEPVGLVISG